MNDILDQILGVLNFVYGERWVAPFVLLPIMFIVAAYVRQRAIPADGSPSGPGLGSIKL